jgi:hypothetical protein
MKVVFKLALLASMAAVVFMADLTIHPGSKQPGWKGLVEVQWVAEAEAIFGRQRRTRRRGAAVGYAAGASTAHAEDAAAASAEHYAAPAPQAAAPAPQAAAPAPQAAAPAPSSGPLPEGTVVDSLPSGCTTESSGGVEYYHCGANTFRTAFQGSNLVYVTAKP